MSTHCLIALKKADGKCVATYCHFDGYPSSAGYILHNYYPTAEAVQDLQKLGHLHSLRPKTYDENDKEHSCIVGDFGDDNTEPYTYETEDAYWDDQNYADFRYLLKDGIWYVNRKKLELP
jgi:predicted CxxxxCH...CXXCH cytochrome family protein